MVLKSLKGAQKFLAISAVDSVGLTRGEIENGSSQILRDPNGMVNYIGQNQKLFGNQRSLFLLLVIFTTVNLWVTNKS